MSTVGKLHENGCIVFIHQLFARSTTVDGEMCPLPGSRQRPACDESVAIAHNLGDRPGEAVGHIDDVGHKVAETPKASEFAVESP